MSQSTSRPKKLVEPKFLVILTLSSGFTFFFEKNSMVDISFAFSQLERLKKTLCPYRFLRYRNEVCSNRLRTELRKNLWYGFLNFCPLKSKKFEFFLNLEESKMLRGEKSKFRCHKVFKNSVMSVLAKFEVNILKTVGGHSFPVNLWFFNRSWKHWKLATVQIFKIFLLTFR